MSDIVWIYILDIYSVPKIIKDIMHCFFILSIFYTYCASQFRRGTFHVLKSPCATIMASTALAFGWERS